MDSCSDTTSISSSIFPYDEDSGLEEEYWRVPKAAGCSEELHEGATKCNIDSLKLHEILGQLSTDDLLEELNRRKQTTPIKTFDGLSEEYTGKAGTRERYGLGIEFDNQRNNRREEAVLARKSSTSSATKNTATIMEANIKREKDKMLSTKTIELFNKKQETLAKLIIQNSSLDLAFLVDCTGSMFHYISQTKQDIDYIVDLIKEEFENKVKLGFVGYRDHQDGFYRIQNLDFSEDIGVFKEFVGSIEATGGDDGPEDVLGGLEAAINLKWSSKNKVLIHVGDAPQHGPRFHDFGPTADKFFYKEPRGLKVENLLDNIKCLNIKYYFAKINGSTDKMVKEFNNVAGYDLVRDIHLKTPDLIAQLVLTSVTQTIDESISNTMKTFQLGPAGSIRVSQRRKSMKDFSISESTPENADMNGTKTVHWMDCLMPEFLNNPGIKKKLSSIKHNWTKAKIKVAKYPFDQGEQRIAYHGKRTDRSGRIRYGEKLVLKEFKFDEEGRDRREEYIEIMETQFTAAYLANEFNKVSPWKTKHIEFLQVSLVQMFMADDAPKYYNAEVLLPDYQKNYRKWSGNCGFVDRAHYSPLLAAFSHWTFFVTDNYLLVVDLQGVDRENKYILTDPSIHCQDPKFGNTNLGIVGIEQFFKTHKCNEICAAMRLPKNKHMKSQFKTRIGKYFCKSSG